jgi:hypothetical protein
MALQRSVRAFLTLDNNPYAVEQIDSPRFGDESALLAGTVLRSEVDYPVAIVLVRSDEVACRFIGFTVDSNPIEQVTVLVGRVVPSGN